MCVHVIFYLEACLHIYLFGVHTLCLGSKHVFLNLAQFQTLLQFFMDVNPSWYCLPLPLMVYRYKHIFPSNALASVYTRALLMIISQELF